MISRCTPAVISQLYGRTLKPEIIFGSYERVVRGCPNSAFGLGPSSPFAAGFSGSPCGMKSFGLPLLPSIHWRCSEPPDVVVGSIERVRSSASCTTYREALTLIAVFPSPDTSHDHPRRGDSDFQFTTSAPLK